MKQAVAKFVAALADEVGRSWNRFWFTPSDPFPLSVLRILVGLATLYFLVSHTADLVRWFGPHGLLPVESVTSMERTLDPSGLPLLRLSYLNLVMAPAGLWFVHLLAIGLVLAFTVGVLTRVTSILSLLVVLSYVHRAPIITGQFEPVLTMMLFYLCLAPAGLFLSVDHWFEKRRRANRPSLNRPGQPQPPTSTAATVAIRLMQIHLALLYLFMGLSKAAGQPWWDGMAVWWLIAHTESRVVDLTFLHTVPYLVYFWTHMIVLFELSFGVMIWNRWARPLLLVVAVPMWLSLGLVTGLVSFALMMLVANLAFVPAEATRAARVWCVARFGWPAKTRLAETAAKGAATT